MKLTDTLYVEKFFNQIYDEDSGEITPENLTAFLEEHDLGDTFIYKLKEYLSQKGKRELEHIYISYKANMLRKKKIRDLDEKEVEEMKLFLPVNWHDPNSLVDTDQKINYIFGTDPYDITEMKRIYPAQINLQAERGFRVKKGDIFEGPNNVQYKVIKRDPLNWLRRILCMQKYYNAKLTVVEEK